MLYRILIVFLMKNTKTNLHILLRGDVINLQGLFHSGSANGSSKMIIFNFMKKYINQKCFKIENFLEYEFKFEQR